MNQGCEARFLVSNVRNSPATFPTESFGERCTYPRAQTRSDPCFKTRPCRVYSKRWEICFRGALGYFCRKSQKFVEGQSCACTEAGGKICTADSVTTLSLINGSVLTLSLIKGSVMTLSLVKTRVQGCGHSCCVLFPSHQAHASFAIQMKDCSSRKFCTYNKSSVSTL